MLAEVSETPHKSPPRGKWLGRLTLAYWLYGLAVLAASVSVWVELASHFVWQAILGGACLAMLCCWRRRWRLATAVVIPWCYLVVLFQPWHLWLGSPVQSHTQRLKVMSWNVLCLNQNIDEMRTVIENHSVDIVVLIEVRPNLFEQLPELDKMYKHRLAYPSWGGNGIAILTNRDDVELSHVDLDGRIMPSVVASVGGKMKLIGVHTWSPYPPSRAVPRDRQLHALIEWVKQQPEPLCVVGDLNITPWAPKFQSMLSAGLVDSRTSGFGNSASWPSWLGPLGIPIDHALSYGACRITQRHLGPIVYGSDHRPVLIEIEY